MRTILIVGGGFSGVEGFGELLSLAAALIRRYPELSPDELSFHLVEARGRILPEVTDRTGEWVVRSLTKRGARVHLNTRLLSARDGHVVLSTGEEFDSALIVAVPTWERKVWVLAVWATAVPFGRDIVSLASVQHPREAFLAGAGSRVPPPAEASGARMDVVMAGDAPRS